MKAINMRSALVSLGYLALELIGRGVVIDKDILIEHCKKGEIVEYLLSYADNEVNNYHFYQDEIDFINNNLYEYMIVSKLNIYGNRPDQHIKKTKTQGLNAVLLVVIYYLSD